MGLFTSDKVKKLAAASSQDPAKMDLLADYARAHAMVERGKKIATGEKSVPFWAPSKAREDHIAAGKQSKNASGVYEEVYNRAKERLGADFEGLTPKKILAVHKLAVQLQAQAILPSSLASGLSSSSSSLASGLPSTPSAPAANSLSTSSALPATSPSAPAASSLSTSSALAASSSSSARPRANAITSLPTTVTEATGIKKIEAGSGGTTNTSPRLKK